ncbi:CaiB/BaiF CoA transferase family protein [Phytohabitans suffuscus]
MTELDATGLPLQGIRVLELASLYAAPLAGTILADFGADVIKIEPPEGDLFRGTGMWTVVARGKRSVVLDVREPSGQSAVRELAREVDVLLHNVPPRVLEKWGLGNDQLRAVNPDLVVVSVTCFGVDGPNNERPGSGTLAEAFGGLTHLTGEADGPPVLPSVALGDAIAALSTVVGTLLAIRARERGLARGQLIDLAMYEPVLQAVSQAVAAHTPGMPPPRRTGSKLANPVAVRNVFRTADQNWVAVSCSTARQACSSWTDGSSSVQCRGCHRRRGVSDPTAQSSGSTPTWSSASSSASTT